MRQHRVGHFAVVIDQLALGEPDVRKDDPLGMRDGYFGVVHREAPSEGAEWSGMAERDGHPVVKAGTRRVFAVLTGTILVAVIVVRSTFASSFIGGSETVPPPMNSESVVPPATSVENPMPNVIRPPEPAHVVFVQVK